MSELIKEIAMSERVVTVGEGTEHEIKYLLVEQEREWWEEARLVRTALLQGADLTAWDERWDRNDLFDQRRQRHYDAAVAKIAAGHADDDACTCPVCQDEADRWFDILHIYDPYLNEPEGGW
jgi:hypothetical protein